MRMKKPIYIAAIGLLLLLLVTVLVVAAYMWIDKINQRRNPLFTVYPCITDTASWNGLAPGVSTRADMIERLGEPIDERYYGDGYDRLTFSPVITKQSKTRPELWNDYVYIDPETEIVLWIDEHVSNADGQFHIVAEIADEYGELIDQVYLNELGGDLVSGEHIYVWAGCGLALNVVPEGRVGKNPDEPIPVHAPERPIDSYGLYQRFPYDVGAFLLRGGSYAFQLPMWQRFLNTKRILENDPDFSYIQPDAKDVIWRRIYFAPSSFAEFERKFQNSIRLANWVPRSYRLLE